VNTTPDTPTPLPEGGLRALLRNLGTVDGFGNPPPQRTGCIHLVGTDSSRGRIWLRRGLVYSVQYDGFTPPIARRLLASADISAEEYDKLTATGHEDDESTIYMHTRATREHIESVNWQMLLSSLTLLYRWRDATWHWEPEVTTTISTTNPLEPNLLVTAAEERLSQWAALERNYPDVCDPDAIPCPPQHMPAGGDLHPETRAILNLVDGTVSNMFIAGSVGLTRFELAGRLAHALANKLITYATTSNDDSEFTVTLNQLQQQRETLLQQLHDLDTQIESLTS
jgi:hypothetical protein